MKFILTSTFSAFMILSGVPSFAQDRPADISHIRLDKIRAEKKLVVAENLPLTESEAPSFWAVYEAYQKDLDDVDTRLGVVIHEYVQAHRYGEMIDKKAEMIAKNLFAIEATEVDLHKTYFARLTKFLPATKAMRYLQIENRIRASKRLEMMSEIPLIEKTGADAGA